MMVNYSTIDMRDIHAEHYRGGRVIASARRAEIPTPGLAPPPRDELLSTLTASYTWLLPFDSQEGDRLVIDFSEPTNRGHYRVYTEMREPGYWVGSVRVIPYR